ncbi:uncharacterized protein PG986_004120 [Apiospora aurea]|uniref:Cupin 2 conserved barrel domain-containing protein n=1 Tax=Apiospora aurea TaxID=335848 RepID=A0ABR1QLP2_9PEZI
MLSFMRCSNPPRRNTASQARLYYEDDKSWQEFSPPGSEYFVRHSIPTGSMFNPPLHLHLFQTERFRCVSGTGVWYQPTHPEASKRRVVMRGGDPHITLQAGLFHRFENASVDEDLVVDIGLDPESQDAEMEHRFFRNFFGYLEDCRVQKTEPSLFQLELFLWSVDGPLAIPVPGIPNWVNWWISRGFMVVLGKWIGESLLGYRASYPEYYSGPMRKQVD